MEELLPTLRAEIVSAWRFRWWAMVTAWILCLVGFVGIAVWPDSYSAQAVVYVDVSSRLDEVISGVAVEYNIQEQVDRVKREMLSHPVLEVVARETDLGLRVETPQEMSSLLGTLQTKILITETQRRAADPRRPIDTVLTISYSDRSRDTALEVVDTLLKTFVRDVVRSGQGASEVARTFLIAQIADYQRMLSERDEALAKFKRENVGLLPGDGASGSGNDYFTRLQTSMEQLQAAQADLRAATNRRDALRAQLSSQNPTLPPGLAPQNSATAAPVSDTQARIDELEDDLADLSLRFTDVHPDVVATKQQLERLYAQRQAEVAALAAAGGSEFEGSAVSTNPVYQSIQIALNEAKVEIAGIESRIQEQERKVTDLRDKVNVMPEVEVRLAALTRDYAQVKAVHDQLVSSLEQEKLGSAAVSDDVNFSVIQPPVAAFTPTMPHRLLFLAGVFVVAVAGGAGVAYLMTMLRPVFARARALQQFSQLPVLGTVSAMSSPVHLLQVRRQLIVFCALGLLLVVTFGVLVGVRQQAAALAQTLLT